MTPDLHPLLERLKAAKEGDRRFGGFWFAPSWLAQQIAISLLDDRKVWDTSDRHVWMHKNGVSVWVANEAYGLGINVGHNCRAHPSGGALSLIDRRYIWDAAKIILAEKNAAIRTEATERMGRSVYALAALPPTDTEPSGKE